jgi:GNAT superfamily N-acetyltransferase
MTLALLDNIAWHSLSGAQAHLAAGSATARRYVRGLAPLIGFADQARPDFAALAAHCEVGEALYTAGWSGPAPAGWRIVSDTKMMQMVWHGAAPAVDEGFAAVSLQPAHAAQILALQVLTRPGPCGPRALEFGSYFGCFEGERLIALAGERMHAGTLRETSSVCTDPAFRGRGLARRLVARLVQQQLQRGQTPFLHVRCENHSAYALYLSLGFCDHQELTNRVVARVGPS